MNLIPIHSDFRGSISSLVGDLKENCEVVVLKTNAGYARGGCIHPDSVEHLTVIEGMIEYHYIPKGFDEQTIILRAGQSKTIQSQTPHYYVSTTDSIVIEWGPDASEKGCRHTEMRRIVEEHNGTI